VHRADDHHVKRLPILNRREKPGGAAPVWPGVRRATSVVEPSVTWSPSCNTRSTGRVPAHLVLIGEIAFAAAANHRVVARHHHHFRAGEFLISAKPATWSL